MLSYLANHWRGEQSLLISIGVNLVVGYILMTTFFVVTGQMIPAQAYFVLGMTVYVVWMTWALVGAFRSTIRRWTDDSASTMNRIIAGGLCLLIVFVALVAASDVWRLIRHYS